jgi:hypothetical protein
MAGALAMSDSEAVREAALGHRRNASSAITPGQAPDCHTIRKQTGILILAHDGPSRNQIITTDDSKETWWTNSYLQSTPPPSAAKGPGAGK